MGRSSRIGLSSLVVGAVGVVGCTGHVDVPPQPSASASSSTKEPVLVPDNPKEPHFANLTQLTFGGENAEAYWSWASDKLIMQARAGEQKCDRIYTLGITAGSKPVPVSSGKGATTCSFFLPGDQDVIFASTELGSPACPPKPDMSKGYVWALYDTYDVFRSKPDGSGMTRLTDAPGYDAEGTVCSKDGSIVFTSVRDGDIELYRMDADGKNQKRLTNTPGYDGGAFFSADCSKIVWRASRPKEGKELDDYKKLLSEGLVKPTKLEIFVANADGTDPVQLTYLGGASFAPFFFPDGKRVFFSSNFESDQRGPEFDIYAVDIDGKNLEKITNSPGFDSFPMFSPDGKKIAFSSNRGNKEGGHDTNVFVADWIPTPPPKGTAAADRLIEDATWLADPAREGRGVGTKGIEAAGAWIGDRMKSLGLEPAGADGYKQAFDVVTKLDGEAKLTLTPSKAGSAEEAIDAPRPLSFSSTVSGLDAPLVFANYGVDDKAISDYKGLDVKGKIVVVRRYVPEDKAFDSSDMKRKHGDLRQKAWVAREKGAKGIIVVDYPVAPKGDKDWKMPDEGKIPGLSPDAKGDAGIPALIVTRASFSKVVDRLIAGEKINARIDAKLTPTTSSAYNVIGRVKAKGASPKPGVIVVGAHYDHLGHGEHGSFAAGEDVIHPGADDNASGTATILEVARMVAQGEVKLDRDVVFVAFSGEERGLLGSSFMTKNPPPGIDPKDIVTMVNLDMVGRMRSNVLSIMGHDTATELGPIVKAGCDATRIACNLGDGGGFGPSDHSSFYAKDVPVLFLFSGSEPDYHRPTDTPDKLNGAGMAQVAKLVGKILDGLSTAPEHLALQHLPSPLPNGDQRSFNASLGTIPDYAGSDGKNGVLLAGVRPGGGAEKGGMKKGDVLVKLGTHEIKNVEDLMFVLNGAKPGETMKAVVKRDGKEVTLDVTFQASAPHK